MATAEEKVRPKLIGRFRIHPADVDFMLGFAFFLGVVAGAVIVEAAFQYFL